MSTVSSAVAIIIYVYLFIAICWSCTSSAFFLPFSITMETKEVQNGLLTISATFDQNRTKRFTNQIQYARLSNSSGFQAINSVIKVDLGKIFAVLSQNLRKSIVDVEKINPSILTWLKRREVVCQTQKKVNNDNWWIRKILEERSWILGEVNT